MSEDRVDIIIPLSDESCSNNDELRICLRSIDKYAEDAGRIIKTKRFTPNFKNE